HVDSIAEVCRERDVTIGIIATPAQGAQAVCDLLVSAGVRCILNFAPVALQVPAEVEVRKVDLSVELQVLAFHVARRHVTEHPPGVNGHGLVNGHGVNGTAVPR
ncbi:MAG: redox-sensing transcriptional repressor Rex, partial [Pseudonocardia sp.]|nr:redox-sensing transcriptional repressor Rex [Pseudonocardia sp.]